MSIDIKETRARYMLGRQPSTGQACKDVLRLLGEVDRLADALEWVAEDHRDDPRECPDTLCGRNYTCNPCVDRGTAITKARAALRSVGR